MKRSLPVRILTLCVVVCAPGILAQGSIASEPATRSGARLLTVEPAEALLTRSKAMMVANPVEAVTLARAAERALRLKPKSTAQQVEIATAQWLAGEGLIRSNDVAAAKPIVLRALRLAEQLVPGSKLAGDLLSSRAGLHASDGRLDKALNDYRRAFAVFRNIGDLRAQAVTLQHIGSVYQDAADFERVLYYYGLSTETFPADPFLKLSSSNNRANALDQLGRHREAEREYKMALEVVSEIGNSALRARVLDNLAQSQIKQGKLADASRNIAMGLALTNTDDAAGWHPLLLGTAAKLSLHRGDTEQAIDRIERALRESVDQAEAAPYRDIHGTAYEAYKRQGDLAQALRHFETFKRLDDQGRSLAASASAKLTAARFDFANQNNRINALKTGQLERDFALAKLKTQRLIIIIGSLLGIAAIVAITLGLYLRSLRRSARAIADNNVKLNKVNVALEEALHAKSQFLATTSHEIRTPLNGVLGMTQILLADPIVTGDIRDRIVLIHQAGESMGRLVDDILDTAKSDAEDIELHRNIIDLRALLTETVHFWTAKAEASGIGLNVDVSRCPDAIIEDEKRLRQILNNIIANAIKFTPSGSVCVEAFKQVIGDRMFLDIRCTDTGIGIADDKRDDVFEKFVQLDGSVTRRFGGTGLGLAICRKISRAMGGDVFVESKLGAGSIFTLRLPLRQEVLPVPASVETNSNVWPQLDRADVLVIQPNPLSRGIMKEMLTQHVGTLTFAETLEVALKRMSHSPTHLVLIDGSTAAAAGLAAINAVEEFLVAVSISEIPVVLLWPQAEVGGSRSSARFGKEGLCKMIAKPVSAQDLLAGMRSVLEASSGDNLMLKLGKTT